MGRAAPGDQQGDDNQLRHGHDHAGDVGGAFDTELDRQRADPELAIPLDRLEVVQGHDAVRTEAVQQRDQYDARVREAGGDNGRGREPGHALIADRHRAVAPPAVQLEAQGRRAVNPGEDQGEHGGTEAPDAERAGDDQRQAGPKQGDVEPPAPGQPAGRDRPMRLVDGIDLAVIPVIDRLAGGTDQRPGQHHAGGHGQPAAVDGDAAGNDTAHERPHGRKPCDGMQHFEQRGDSRTCHGMKLCQRRASVNLRLHLMRQIDQTPVRSRRRHPGRSGRSGAA